MFRASRILLTNHSRFLAGCTFALGGLWIVLLASRPMERMSTAVVVWWTALCAVSAVNICGWRVSLSALWKRWGSVDPAVYVFQRRQLVLSAVYVLGCCFRAVLPRADVQRIGLYDSWVSSVLLGRSVATVAEICFVIQWALLLDMVARTTASRLGLVISRVLVPLIVVAECCSWYGVLTTSYIGNAVEESIWALSVVLLMIACGAMWRRCPQAWKPFLAAALVMGTGYVAFMCMVDIPMYVSRWLADEAHGRQYLSLGQGLWDVASRWTVTHDWDAWQMEAPWMSLYFSVAVWCSIALAHAPWPAGGKEYLDASALSVDAG